MSDKDEIIKLDSDKIKEYRKESYFQLEVECVPSIRKLLNAVIILADDWERQRLIIENIRRELE